MALSGNPEGGVSGQRCWVVLKGEGIETQKISVIIYEQPLCPNGSMTCHNGYKGSHLKKKNSFCLCFFPSKRGRGEGVNVMSDKKKPCLLEF